MQSLYTQAQGIYILPSPLCDTKIHDTMRISCICSTSGIKEIYQLSILFLNIYTYTHKTECISICMCAHTL